jgi:hypothetical protein
VPALAEPPTPPRLIFSAPDSRTKLGSLKRLSFVNGALPRACRSLAADASGSRHQDERISGRPTSSQWVSSSGSQTYEGKVALALSRYWIDGCFSWSRVCARRVGKWRSGLGRMRVHCRNDWRRVSQAELARDPNPAPALALAEP